MAMNTQTTATSTISSTMKEYWDRKLLENMKPMLIHQQFGQKRPMPANNGKTVTFRKWTPFGALTTPLTEGEPPDGQSLTQTEVEATVKQYGGFVTESDLLDLTAIDNVKMDAAEMMADQGALTLDQITREELHTCPNVIYANGKTARTALAATDKLTSLEIRKAVRTLKKNKAPKFGSGGRSYYVAIVGPDTEFDLQDDPTWVDVSKYQNAEQIYYGEIGMLYGCKVICNTEAKIFADAGATEGSGGGKADVASTLVLGRNAYGLIDISGSGNVQMKMKSAGSAGTTDPLDQINTIGWKVMAFAAKILQPTWMVRIESGFSA